MSLVAELKRRNVFRVGAAYLALGWIVTQVTATVGPVMHLPEWITPVVVWIGAIGFPFVLIFSWVFELTPEGLKREREVERDSSITHVTGRRLDYTIIALLVAAIGLYLVDPFAAARKDATTQAVTAQTLAAPAAPVAANATASAPQATIAVNDKSIAVLPFVDMSAAKDQEYMSDGIAEELLNLLAKIPELQVTSRSSAFAFKGEKLDLAEVARKLGVAHILEGSVRTSGNRVRITAQLIDARRDKHLWSESYDRTLEDIFAVQDEISAAVVAQLKVHLLGEAPKAKTTDPAAYALFLQAQQLRRQGNQASAEKAVELFEKALAIDPNYAAAWDGMGATYANLAGAGLLGSFDEGFAKAREMVDKALAIDPELATAHARLGFLAMSADGDLAAAAHHLQRALELAPTNVTVLSLATGLAANLGRLDNVPAVDAALVVRDPVNPFVHNSQAGTFLALGRADEAIAAYRTNLALSPDTASVHGNIALALVQKGELDAALAEAQLEPADMWRLVSVAIVQHARGHKAESDAAVDEMIARYADVLAFQIAYVLAYRGEADRAFEWLDKAVANKDPGIAEILTQPLFANIQQDPRWLPFLRKVGKAPEQLAAIEFELKVPN